MLTDEKALHSDTHSQDQSNLSAVKSTSTATEQQQEPQIQHGSDTDGSVNTGDHQVLSVILVDLLYVSLLKLFHNSS